MNVKNVRKTTLAALLGAAALGLSSAAAAQSMQQERGWYLGGSLGQMEADGDCPGIFTCDRKDSAWKLFGGYRINRNLAAEAFYGNWGEISVSSGAVRATGEISSWGLAGLGILPIGERFALFGKLGYAQTEQEVSATGPGVTLSNSDDGGEAIFGFGATWNFTRNLGLRAEWERLEKSEVDIMSIGLQYRF
jgi:OOP family OmpA-OmpF porin